MANSNEDKITKHKDLVYQDEIISCLTCEHIKKEEVLGSVMVIKCALFDVYPPPDIVVFGCKEHCPDDIPF